MNAIKDGGSILPAMKSSCGGYGIAPHEHGLTIRDWFAGQWLAGLGAYPGEDQGCMMVADACYRIADAMLAAREGKEEK